MLLIHIPVQIISSSKYVSRVLLVSGIIVSSFKFQVETEAHMLYHSISHCSSDDNLEHEYIKSVLYTTYKNIKQQLSFVWEVNKNSC
jgi:hypothetical protein